MNFANPNLLWLLLVIPPAMIAFFWWSLRKRQMLAAQFIQARLLPALTVGVSTARQKIRLALAVLAVVFVIAALARPQWGFDWEEVEQRGLDIVVAIDTSKSMLAEDIAPNRLARAKLAAHDLMRLAKSDRLGLVAFAGSAFLQCPLTVDEAAFHQSVDVLDVNIIPQGGTALAEAIETSLHAFKEGDNYKVLVLFTDGDDLEPGALEAAKKAAQEGVQIFTIGIGSKEGIVLSIKDAKGRTDYIRDEQGNVVNSRLNEGLLREIASATPKGFYLPLRGVKTIDTLYEQGLAPLPKSEAKAKLLQRYHERFHWPLSVAILLLLAETFFPERKREPRAKSAPSAEARPVLQEVMTILLLLVLPAKVFGSPASALREYEAGKYEQALKEYEQLLQHKRDDPRLHFNAGAAAYRNRQFDEAAKQFNETLVAPDLRLQGQAYYNRGNSFYHLGEAAPDSAKKKETWQKSLQDYQSALKLNRQDADAKFNYEFVKQKLEEIKQQQQKQQNKSDQKQDQDQQKQGEKKDQDQKSQADQKKPEQKQDSAQQNQKSEQQKQEEQQAADQAQKQKEEQEQKEQQARQASGNSKDASDEKDQGEPAQAYAAGQMTPEQARQLLDAQKEDENIMPIKPTGKPVDRSRPIRDW